MISPLLTSTLLGGLALFIWRIRETLTPISPVKIVAPPLAMATGSAMFLLPQFRVSPAAALLAVALGWWGLSYPLMLSSRLEWRQGRIYLQRTATFLKVFFALLALRLVLRGYLSQWMSPWQTASYGYLLALGMVWRWRIDLFGKYWALKRSQP